MLPLLMQGQLALFTLIIIALIISLTFHEFGHAFTAKRFGDDTAERMGRLTLNPVAHIDPLGLMMVALVGFGYAKPVPTNPRNYNSVWAQLMVAAAGPFANLLIAVVAWNLYRYGAQAGWEGFLTSEADRFFSILVGINLLLMVFNLIPLGPLDGHYILPYFLPRPLALRYTVLNDRYGGWFFMGLILLSILGVPIFNAVFRFAMSLLPYITFI
jgi:Zn-dependent protease